VHNVLEAAVYGRPVISGPRIEKYREACELAKTEGLISLPEINTSTSLKNILQKWWDESATADAVGLQAASYVRERAGSVERIMQHIQENRLLIN
jgi:3-deoxy-D-manno-octulosonic-acid transferase